MCVDPVKPDSEQRRLLVCGAYCAQDLSDHASSIHQLVANQRHADETVRGDGLIAMPVNSIAPSRNTRLRRLRGFYGDASNSKIPPF